MTKTTDIEVKKNVVGATKSGRPWKSGNRKPVASMTPKTKSKNAIWKKRMQDKVDALATKVLKFQKKKPKIFVISISGHRQKP